MPLWPASFFKWTNKQLYFSDCQWSSFSPLWFFQRFFAFKSGALQRFPLEFRVQIRQTTKQKGRERKLEIAIQISKKSKKFYSCKGHARSNLATLSSRYDVIVVILILKGKREIFLFLVVSCCTQDKIGWQVRELRSVNIAGCGLMALFVSCCSLRVARL